MVSSAYSNGTKNSSRHPRVLQFQVYLFSYFFELGNTDIFLEQTRILKYKTVLNCFSVPETSAVASLQLRNFANFLLNFHLQSLSEVNALILFRKKCVRVKIPTGSRQATKPY